MSSRAAHFLRSAALAATFALAACGSEDANLAALDNELLANGADPALTSALEDQILVDPNLVQQSHPNAVRPPETPVQAQYPSGPDPRVRRASAAEGSTSDEASAVTGSCAAELDYGPQWAGRLPAEFPAYPGGRVTEAAGSNSGDCRMRVVTFTTSDPYGRVLHHYRSAAARAGYTAEHQVRGADQVLGGVNRSSDAAYFVIVTPVRNGSEVAFIVNKGR